MRIIVDARMVTSKLHGISRILVENLNVWEKINVPHKLVLLANDPESVAKFPFARISEIVAVKSTSFSPGELLEIPGVLKKLGGDLYYTPSASAPLYRVMPTVYTIPDLTPYYYGNLFHKVYFRTIAKNAVNYSEAIIGLSEFVRQDIINLYRCREDKVHFAFPSAYPVFGERVSWEEINRKYQITKPYLFCLANHKPHKNVTGLISIFEKTREKYGKDLKLVFTSRNTDSIRKKIENSPYKADIMRFDYFEEGELDTLYSNAEVFLFPTYYEGFGMPPLEAMIRGCPVVSSNRSSLPEVVGDAGILVDPDNHEEYAEAVVSILNSTEEREKWSKKGIARDGFFSWERSSIKILKILEKVVKKA
jgi:glycosyltransferase involved in cell wall biosynthesis